MLGFVFGRNKLNFKALFRKSTLNILSGCLHEATGNRKRALEKYLEAIKLNPESPALYNRIGQVLYKEGDIKGAARYFQKALDYSGISKNTVYWLGAEDHQTADGDFHHNIALFNRELAKKPGSIKALMAKGFLYQQEGRVREALDTFRHVLSFSPDYYEANQAAGVCLCELGEYNEALAYLLKALSKYREPSLYVNIGLCLSRLGRHQEALVNYEKAEKHGFMTIELLNNKGFSLVELELHKEALICYDLALEMAPQDVTLLSNKGTCLTKAGRHSEAIPVFDMAMENNPDDVTLINNKALCLEAVECFAEALEMYERGLENEPENSTILINKGNCLTKMERIPEAMDCFDRILKNYPAHRQAWSFKGALLEEMGNFSEAVQCYNKSFGLS